jgi:hypothetical protein
VETEVVTSAVNAMAIWRGYRTACAHTIFKWPIFRPVAGVTGDAGSISAMRSA